MQVISIEAIVNLATAFHYFVWPNIKAEDERKIPPLFSFNHGEMLAAIEYARYKMQLTETQTSIFCVQIARIANPSSFMNTNGYWAAQHEYYSETYRDELHAFETGEPIHDQAEAFDRTVKPL
jgi:hypothetical protein